MLARFHDEAKYFSSIQKTPAATSLCRYRGCSWDQRPEWFPLCQSFQFWIWKPLNKRAAPPNLHRHISIWLVHRIRDSVGEPGAVKTRQEGGHWLAATESHSTNRPQSGDQASIPLVCKAGQYQIGCLFALTSTQLWRWWWNFHRCSSIYIWLFNHYYQVEIKAGNYIVYDSYPCVSVSNTVSF